MSVETETTTEQPSSTETPTTPAADAPVDKIDLSKEDGPDPDPDKPTDTPPGDDDDAPDARYGAPEEGTAYDIKLEGDAKIDADALAMVEPELRALNLSNESAQQLVGVFAEKVLPHYQGLFEKNLEASILTTRTGWENAARDLVAGKDAEGAELLAKNKAGEDLSFDGKDLKGVQSVAARALDRLAPKGFREFLDETGLSVHPQMVAFTYQVGKAIAEDQNFDTETVQNQTELTRTEKYYGRKEG